MKISYYGHSSLGIFAEGKNIIVDPFISQNPLAKDIELEKLKADYILITHAHSDHILDLETLVDRTGATVIANHEIATHYNSRKNYDTFGMNHGGCGVFDFGKVYAAEALHSSSFPDGSYGGNPLGFILEAGGKKVYISGDTDLILNMKLIPMFHKLDLAILCIGGTFTMDVDRALVAAEFVECDKVMGVHFDTFPPIQIDHQLAIEKFADKGKTLSLLKVGESLEV